MQFHSIRVPQRKQQVSEGIYLSREIGGLIVRIQSDYLNHFFYPHLINLEISIKIQCDASREINCLKQRNVFC